MKISLLTVPFCIILFGGCQVYNSSTGDQSRYLNSTIDTSTAAGQRLSAATSVFRARCYKCHASKFASYSTDAQWIAGGWVVAGSPQTSMLYGHLYGSNVGGPEDMPQGETLSPTELGYIRDWILGIPP